MSDFNKGDFTQQGVDGHVRATLRLNEKRYVELDLTTNENARGCTISGNVHDRLNNLDYPISSAPSGNIEITENTAEGEPLDISQYATATVNVSGAGEVDLLHTTINLINTSNEATPITANLANYGIITDEKYFFTTADAQEELNTLSLNETVPANSTKTLIFYYAPFSLEDAAFAVITNKSNSDNAENMTYVNNAWVVTDPMTNSVLNIYLER